MNNVTKGNKKSFQQSLTWPKFSLTWTGGCCLPLGVCKGDTRLSQHRLMGVIGVRVDR